MALRRPCTQTLWALAALSAVPFSHGDCLAPVVDGQHPSGSCAEGAVISAFGTCEPQCAEGYILEVASSNGLLLCLSGQLVPSTFQCIGLNCSAPVGIPFGGEEEENHTNCEEGGSVVVHGSYCTPRCRNGYTPNLDGLPWDPVLRKSILPCVAGVLAPSTFTCLGMPCQVPRTGTGEGQILNAHALRPCSIDLPEIPHLGFCDPLCRDGWHPNVSLIQCVASNLTSLFECLGNSCPAPKLVQFAEAVTCQEGPEAEHEGICTPNCKPGYRPSAEVLTCRNGVLTPFRYECFPENCTAHFELPWALPPSPGYNRSLGINSPLVEWVPPEARTCAEGPSMFHRGRCTAQCLPGYEPDIPFLSCNLGNFSPPVYQCVGQPCQALQGIPDAPALTCEEGTVLEHGGSCTTKCDYGFVPSDAVLSCNATVLDPANYTCIGTACNAPSGVANAPTMPCVEPPENLTHGSICTTQCLSGFVPSTPVLHCYGGQLRPASFECIEESVWLDYEPSDDTIAQAWAENVAAARLRDGTALACFKDELSLAIHCVVLLASVTATRQGQWSTLTGPQVEEFVLEPLTLDKAVACYRITGGSTMCRALELVSESLWQGAEVLLSTAETYHISLASLADGAAVCFQQGLDTWRCRLLDVGSSSSLSMGPELVVPGTLSGLALGSLGSRLVACGAGFEGRSHCHLLEVSAGSMLSNISSVEVSTQAAFLVATHLTSPSDAVLLCFSDWSSVSAVCKMLEASGDTLVEAGNVTVDHGVTRYLSVGAVSASRALLCMERQGPLLEHCMDRRLQCEDWAAAGECGFNPKFMFDLCPQTCGVCTQVGASQGRCHGVGVTSDGILQAGPEAVVNDGISWNFAAAVVRSDTALVCFSDSTRRDAARCRTVWGPRNWDPLEVRACSENVSASCVP